MDWRLLRLSRASPFPPFYSSFHTRQLATVCTSCLDKMPVLLGPFVCPISVSNDLMAVKGAAVLEKKRKGEERGRDTAGRTMTDCGPKEEEDGDVCRTRPPAVPGAEKSAFASGAAAIVTCCVLHPLDLIKTRLQGTLRTRAGACANPGAVLVTARVQCALLLLPTRPNVQR